MHNILLLSLIFQCVSTIHDRECFHLGDTNATFFKCMEPGVIEMVTYYDITKGCTKKGGYKQDICTFDISEFTEEEVNQLFSKLNFIWPHLKCNNSALIALNFTNLWIIGHIVRHNDFPLKDNKQAMVIVNNMNLKTIDFGKKLLHKENGAILPGFWTIWNNPRLTRYSIDSIKTVVQKRYEEFKHREDNDDRKVFPDKIIMQEYGNCNFTFTNPRKTSLSWEEFRWCRSISHDVILEGAGFKPERDTAYIQKVNGSLKIRNTNIEDLNFLPVNFETESLENEISGNKKLCVSFEDEIRFKRLGFHIGTTCNTTNLSQEEVLKLKDCVTVKGGLRLEGIDESMASADLFKTVRIIEGLLEIINVTATIDFRKLEKIIVNSSETNMILSECSHPILFPSLRKLEGSDNSAFILFKNCRCDALKYLNRIYPGKIVDSSKIVIITTTSTSASTVATPAESQPGSVGNSAPAPSAANQGQNPENLESHSLAVSKEPETSTYRSFTTPEKDITTNGTVNITSAENDSISSSRTAWMIVSVLAGSVFLLTSLALAVILIKFGEI